MFGNRRYLRPPQDRPDGAVAGFSAGKEASSAGFTIITVGKMWLNKIPSQAAPNRILPHRMAALISLAKTQIPPARMELVTRPRLVGVLDAALQAHHRLILISASAGFGKTTLLSEWVHSGSLASYKIAWVSLDKDDNDNLRFWNNIFAAVRAHGSGRTRAHRVFGRHGRPYALNNRRVL
jgi:hypothetical protein